MRRRLLFCLLLLVFLVWTFPHRVLVERLISKRLAELDIDVALSQVAPAWPPGYRIEELLLQHGPYSLRVDSLWLDLFTGGGLRFDADACGGTVRGALAMEPDQSDPRAAKNPGERLEVLFDHVDPSACMHLGTLAVSGSFAGEARLDGIGHGVGELLGRVSRNGRIVIEAHDGTVGGYLPAPRGSAGSSAQPEGFPIGEWMFGLATLEAHVAGADIVIDKASARAEDIEWELDKARLGPGGAGGAGGAGGNGGNGGVRITGDFRARGLDDSVRAKAILGLLPKAGEDEDGWRHYRVAGSLAAPRIVGMK